HVDPFGHHDSTTRADVMHLEFDRVHTSSEAFDGRADRVASLHRSDGNVVVHGVVREERQQRVKVTLGPRLAEPGHRIDRTLAHFSPLIPAIAAADAADVALLRSRPARNMPGIRPGCETM